MMIHLVNIQQKTSTQDTTTGEITEAWTNLYTDIFCDIKPVSVRDFIQSQAHQSEITARIVLPFLPGLDATQRIVATCGCHAGRIYNPAGFLEDDQTGQEYMTAPCSEGVNEG